MTLEELRNKYPAIEQRQKRLNTQLMPAGIYYALRDEYRKQSNKYLSEEDWIANYRFEPKP